MALEPENELMDWKLTLIVFFLVFLVNRMLPSYLGRMEKVDEAIEANYEIIKIICEDQQIFVNDELVKVETTQAVTFDNSDL